LPLFAREGVAAQLDSSRRHPLAIPARQDVGVEGHLAERHPDPGAGLLARRERSVGRLLEEAVEGHVAQLDALEPLDAARPAEARHDHAQRSTVNRGQRLAVHLPRQQHLGRSALRTRSSSIENH